MNITTLIPDNSGLVDWPTLSADKKAVVTVGAFDGMHRGHRAVIERTVQQAKATQSFSVVIMFDPRPNLVHQYAGQHQGTNLPEDAHDDQKISGIRQRLRIMRELGVDHVLVVRYTLAFAAKSYRFFLGQLVGKLGMRMLVLGADAVMGANRAGDIKAISLLAQATGVFQLEVVDDLGPGYVRVPALITPQAPESEGEPVDPTASMNKAELRAWSKSVQGRKVRVWSSSHVRYLLSQGRIKDANEVLGHAHGIEDTVVHGEQRGRTIGFPTANLDTVVDGYLPVDGVYAGWLIDLGEQDSKTPGSTDSEASDGHKYNSVQQYRDEDARSDSARLVPHSPWRWPAAISIGTKPTYSEETGITERVVEAYALHDEWLDLYGHRVCVEFAGFLRPQIAFDGTDALVEALKKNVEETRELTGDMQ